MRKAECRHNTFTIIIKDIEIIHNTLTIWTNEGKFTFNKIRAEPYNKTKHKNTDYKHSAKPHDLRQIEDMDYQIKECYSN